MKTSSSQFELMVTFMEQHGDLSKPSSNARGKIFMLKNWDELTGLLNSDGTGDTKTTEKWKKVWSDYKNNIKKKAARLFKAASGTGGGPATFSKLTDLEHRVLNLIGVQVATGLAVEEAGLPQDFPMQPNPLNIEQPVQIIQPYQLIDDTLQRAVSSPPHTFLEEEIQSPQPGPSACTAALSPTQIRVVVTPIPSFIEVQTEERVISPTRPSSGAFAQPEPALSGQTTPRRARQSRLPRRKKAPAHTEQAAQNFLQAEEFWRKFKIEQHKDYMEIRREQNRIRELEVQAQTEWRALGLRVVDVIDKIVDKFCKD